MSKTQEKRAQRLADAAEFMKEKRTHQIAFLEANYKAGVQLYEITKENATEEERTFIEAEMVKQRAALDAIKKEFEIE
jgi:hypothetical protein